MRIVIAILSAAIVLLSTWLYQQTLAENQAPSEQPLQTIVNQEYRLRISATFDAGVDPFAEELAKAASLKVTYQGEELLVGNQPIPAGEVTEAEIDLELPTGRNEFLIEMSPSDSAALVPRAVHVQLFKGDGQQPLQTETLWAPPTDSLVVGTVGFEVKPSASNEQ
ncbi:hypothetical protein AB1L30_12460 [Bremerella sp. JC817]